MIQLHDTLVLGVAICRVSNRVLSCGGTSCAIWDPLSGSQEFFWDTGAMEAVFSPRGGLVAMNELTEISLWDVSGGRAVERGNVDCSTCLPQDQYMDFGLAVSEDETRVYAGSGRSIITAD